MPLFPSYDALRHAMGIGRYSSTGPKQQQQQQQHSNLNGGATPLQARLDLYPAYSVIDDAKDKAKKLRAEAVKDLEAASQLAQDKTGHIQLYTGKYYAACTFGGLLACVSHLPNAHLGLGHVPKHAPGC
jgi:solute carrier family 25 phosphate transporter 3